MSPESIESGGGDSGFFERGEVTVEERVHAVTARLADRRLPVERRTDESPASVGARVVGPRPRAAEQQLCFRPEGDVRGARDHLGANVRLWPATTISLMKPPSGLKNTVAPPTGPTLAA